jgi:hypothetical protein
VKLRANRRAALAGMTTKALISSTPTALIDRATTTANATMKNSR